MLEEVHDRDTVLVPYGWHGPCVAAPGFDMYYLNVMAGPAAERVWKISDHPDQTWVRDTWKTQSIDSRLVSERLVINQHRSRRIRGIQDHHRHRARLVGRLVRQ